MTENEAKNFLIGISYKLGNMAIEYLTEKDGEKMREAIKALEQEPCEMTAEEYRQRMIQAFHNADTDELIAVCVLPTEKEFEHLEWLLKNHYKQEPKTDSWSIKDVADTFKKHGLIREQEPCDDCISRQAVLELMADYDLSMGQVVKGIHALPSITPKPKTGKWIPVSERLPDNTDPVNITWVNHNPESYYVDIKDKPFTETGHYCNGRWWWYSVTCQDYLDEYGHWDIDAMDDAIEVIAWMPLPEPYKVESEDKE